MAISRRRPATVSARVTIQEKGLVQVAASVQKESPGRLRRALRHDGVGASSGS